MQWLFCTNFKFHLLSSIRPDSNDVTLSLGLAEEILPVDLMSSLRGAMSDPENSEFKINADKPLSVNNELGTFTLLPSDSYHIVSCKQNIQYRIDFFVKKIFRSDVN